MNNNTTFRTAIPYAFEVDTHDMGYEEHEVKSLDHAFQILIDYLKNALDPANWDTNSFCDFDLNERKELVWEYLMILDLVEKRENLTITHDDVCGYDVYIPVFELLKEQQ